MPSQEEEEGKSSTVFTSIHWDYTYIFARFNSDDECSCNPDSQA